MSAVDALRQEKVAKVVLKIPVGLLPGKLNGIPEQRIVAGEPDEKGDENDRYPGAEAVQEWKFWGKIQAASRTWSSLYLFQTASRTWSSLCLLEF